MAFDGDVKQRLVKEYEANPEARTKVIAQRAGSSLSYARGLLQLIGRPQGLIRGIRDRETIEIVRQRRWSSVTEIALATGRTRRTIAKLLQRHRLRDVIETAPKAARVREHVRRDPAASRAEIARRSGCTKGYVSVLLPRQKRRGAV